MSPAGGGDGVRVALAGRAQRRGEVLGAARRRPSSSCRRAASPRPVPEEPAGGSRLPWKSLKESSCTSTVRPRAVALAARRRRRRVLRHPRAARRRAHRPWRDQRGGDAATGRRGPSAAEVSLAWIPLGVVWTDWWRAQRSLGSTRVARQGFDGLRAGCRQGREPWHADKGPVRRAVRAREGGRVLRCRVTHATPSTLGPSGRGGTARWRSRVLDRPSPYARLHDDDSSLSASSADRRGRGPRRAHPRQADAVLALLAEAARDGRPAGRVRAGAAAAAGRRRAQGVRHLLLGVGGELVGYAQLEDTDPVEAPAAELVVHPAHRGRGHGRALGAALLAASGKRLRVWAHGGHSGRPAPRAGARPHPLPRTAADAALVGATWTCPSRCCPPGVTVRTFVPGPGRRGLARA